MSSYLALHQLQQVAAGVWANPGDAIVLGEDGEWTFAPNGGVGGATTLDALTDVDTTTTAPADQQFLKFDLTSGLWVPADLPSSTTGAPFDITDTPPDPPPYAGYAYMTSD